MSSRNLVVSNGNVMVMRFAKGLLKGLGIQSTGPRLAQRGGRYVVIKGKVYRANKDIYVLRIRTSSLQDYAQRVGFAVLRKQTALSLALRCKVGCSETL